MTQANTPAASEPPYPSPAYSWYVVVLLLLAYIVSWLDRQILSYIIGPIKASFGLSDTEMGLLLGPAFAIFYITLGIPIGWLADRKSRRMIIAWGIAFWSFMTAISAFSKNFTHLFLARLGVGVGEATLTPSALSLIADYFPKDQRGRATSVYMSGISMGTALGSILGGWIVAQVTQTPEVTLPLFGTMEGWRATFLICGIPGLLLALLMLTVREPYRRDRVAIGGGQIEAASLTDALKYYWSRRGAFGCLWVGQTGMTIIGYAQFFNVEFFRRTWGWGMAEIGLTLGIMFLIFGPGGANFGGWLADRFTKNGDKGGPMRAVLVANIILIPMSIVYPLMPTPWLAIAFLSLSTLGGAMASACGATATTVLAPNQVRAQAVAVYWVIINFAGLFIGPPLVGLITDRVFGDEAAIGYGMSMVAALIGVLVLPLLWRGLTHYRAEMAILERQAKS
ncbi:MAG: MFS transporter [Rhodospirillaceae bacterium]|nr:MFS transporter [Rhodospirillaceae bacterium]